jgi:hypothetical protein
MSVKAAVLPYSQLVFSPQRGSIRVWVISHYNPKLDSMNDSTYPSPTSHEKVEVSLRLDPDILEQLQHLTNDPSKVVEVALRQWLRNESRRDEEFSRTLPRNPPVPPRGEWND